MNKDELVQKYTSLKDIYGLPIFEDLDKEFLVSFTIASWHDIPDNTLIFMLNRVMDYSNNWIGWAHNLINGSPQSMILMRESSFFDEAQKKELILLMTKLTFFSRKQTLINLKNEESGAAELINEIFSEWKSIKSILLKYCEISCTQWKFELESQPKL